MAARNVSLTTIKPFKNVEPVTAYHQGTFPYLGLSVNKEPCQPEQSITQVCQTLEDNE